MKYQNFATGSSHILIPFIIGIGAEWGMVTKILLQRFLVGMLDHFEDAERGTSMYKVFLNALVATSWKAIKLHQEKYNVNSVIPHNALASDYLTDCHQALFFQQGTLVFKKLAFDGFYPLLVVLQKNRFLLCLKMNSVIPHNVLASDYLTDCHHALFFQQDTLVY